MIKILGLFILFGLMVSIPMISWYIWHNVLLTTLITIVWELMLASGDIDNL